jgi:hypothetical protein
MTQGRFKSRIRAALIALPLLAVGIGGSPATAGHAIRKLRCHSGSLNLSRPPRGTRHPFIAQGRNTCP